MSASVFSHNGRASAVPRVSVRTDYSALNRVNPASTNAIAVLGQGVGPKPSGAGFTVDDFTLVRSPAEARSLIKSGDLLEMILKMFSPSTSPEATGRPEYIIALPTNQSVQGSLTLANTIGDSQVLTSVKYGAFTNQIRVTAAAGTTTSAARHYTIVADGITYDADDLGVVEAANTGFETSIIGFRYDVSGISLGNGYAQMSVDKLVSGVVRATGYETIVGGNAGAPTFSPTTDLPDSLTAVSNSAGDTTQTVTVLALVGGVLTPLSAVLNGVTPVPLRDAVGVAATATAIFGVRLSGATVGTQIDVATATTPTTIAQVDGSAAQVLAVEAYTSMLVAGVPVAIRNVTGSASGSIVLEGWNSAGVYTRERVTLTLGRHVKSTNSWSRIAYVYVGDMANTETISLQAVAVSTSTAHNTMQKVADHFNSFSAYGLTATLYSGFTSMDPVELDSPSASVPIHAALGHLGAVEYATRTWVNSTGVLTAARSTFSGQSATITVTSGDAADWTIAFGGGFTGATQAFSGSATPATVATNMAAAINAMTLGTPRLIDVTASAAGAVVTVTVANQVLSTPFTITVTPGGAGAATVALAAAQAGSDVAPTASSVVFQLTNGSDGSTYDWTNALAVLEQSTVNSIVVLSGEPSVHSALKTHLQSRADQSNACDGFVGLSALDGSGNATGALPTKTSIKTQIRSLNYPKIRAAAESASWYNSDGVLTTFAPWFVSGLAAAMQAAVPVAEPLTKKIVSVEAVYRDASWNPSTHADELVRAGLWFTQPTSRGFEVVRNVTTWIGSTNIALNEGSVQHVANLLARDGYSVLTPFIGRPNSDAMTAIITGQVSTRALRWRDLGWITAFQLPTVTRVDDRQVVSISVSVTQPLNFIEVNLFLV